MAKKKTKKKTSKNAKKIESGTYAHFQAKSDAMTAGEREANDRANRAEVLRMLDRSSQGPVGRPLPEDCLRVRLSTRKLALLVGEDAKRERFEKKFIESGLIAAEWSTPRTCIFDFDEIAERWPILRKHEAELLRRKPR